MGGMATRKANRSRGDWHSCQGGENEGARPGTTYFFIFVKVMRALSNDLRSYFESFLIFLAKRFNTAYDLLLITGRLVQW